MADQPYHNPFTLHSGEQGYDRLVVHESFIIDSSHRVWNVALSLAQSGRRAYFYDNNPQTRIHVYRAQLQELREQIPLNRSQYKVRTIMNFEKIGVLPRRVVRPGYTQPAVTGPSGSGSAVPESVDIPGVSSEPQAQDPLSPMRENRLLPDPMDQRTPNSPRDDPYYQNATDPRPEWNRTFASPPSSPTRTRHQTDEQGHDDDGDQQSSRPWDL